jgi:hypothetical protein
MTWHMARNTTWG